MISTAPELELPQHYTAAWQSATTLHRYRAYQESADREASDCGFCRWAVLLRTAVTPPLKAVYTCVFNVAQGYLTNVAWVILVHCVVPEATVHARSLYKMLHFGEMLAFTWAVQDRYSSHGLMKTLSVETDAWSHGY